MLVPAVDKDLIAIAIMPTIAVALSTIDEVKNVLAHQ
jgi:hypothetical protein